MADTDTKRQIHLAKKRAYQKKYRLENEEKVKAIVAKSLAKNMAMDKWVCPHASCGGKKFRSNQGLRMHLYASRTHGVPPAPPL